ncbi:MAG: glycosyltransferase family 1 protein, partial [Chloroflexi bacterium]|nr:glycosyltransferase family 1 protein [Chloroflexota bacterium]
AEPAVFAGPAADEDIDIFFYGHGREYRERWIDAMLVQPSERLPRVRFAVRGTRLGTPARIAALPYASFNALKGYCRRSRINILITRQAHASVYASSTARPFELAAIGSAMVSNPYLGIEEWFEPGREVLIVHNADEAVATYRELLSDGAARRDLASRARERLLAEHTYAHRARYLRTLLSGEARETPHIVSAAASE